MRRVIIKSLALLTMLISVMIGIYYWGFLCGKQNINHDYYEQLVLKLSNDILIRDSIEVSKTDAIKPLINATITSDFIRMLVIYDDYQFITGEKVRCAVTRKVRSLYESGAIDFDIESLEQAGSSIEALESYMNAECLGKPSHYNWAE